MQIKKIYYANTKTTVLIAVLLSAVIPLWASPDEHAERSCIVTPDNSNLLPKSVVRVIMDSDEATFARKLFREQGCDPYESVPLRGVSVPLADVNGVTWYLVGGTGTPITGADHRWYWLVQQSGGSAKILLYVGTGCVQIESKATLGYRNVWTRWQTAGYAIVREYRWNGQAYTQFRRYTDHKAW